MKKARRKSGHPWLLVMVFAVVLIAAAVTSIIPAIDEPVPDSLYAHIRAVDGEGENPLIVTDFVEFLTGEDAIAAGLIDTKCARETMAECIPSIAKGYYVRNLSQDTAAIRFTSGTSVLVFGGAPEGALRSVSADEFFAMYAGKPAMRTTLFKVSHIDSYAVAVEEIETP